MTANSACERCGLRSGTFGNCPASPPCKPHPLGPRCKKCGASDFAGARCPEQPTLQARVGGGPWVHAPRFVRDCIAQDEAWEKLGDMIRDAYARHAAKKEPETPAPGIL